MGEIVPVSDPVLPCTGCCSQLPGVRASYNGGPWYPLNFISGCHWSFFSGGYGWIHVYYCQWLDAKWQHHVDWNCYYEPPYNLLCWYPFDGCPWDFTCDGARIQVYEP